MYTINIRGKQNPKDQKMVKLELIFFKTGYARVPKVLNITPDIDCIHKDKVLSCCLNYH